MYEARIEFTIGSMSFVGEGEKEWVSDQLDKILEKASELSRISLPQDDIQEQTPTSQAIETVQGNNAIASEILPIFLQEKDAAKNQIKKFLATSVWLMAKGKNRLTTGDVTQALRESNQTRLKNASDCLNKNVGKGFCEKDGKEFFVTQEGSESL